MEIKELQDGIKANRMQLKRKQETEWTGSSGHKGPDKQVNKRLKMSQRERNLYQEDNSAELPHGKYVGRTLGWVKATDDWYYNWLWDNDLILSWGLCQLKGEQAKKKYTHHITDDSERWIELYEVEEPCEPAPEHWYKQQ